MYREIVAVLFSDPHKI